MNKGPDKSGPCSSSAADFPAGRLGRHPADLPDRDSAGSAGHLAFDHPGSGHPVDYDRSGSHFRFDCSRRFLLMVERLNQRIFLRLVPEHMKTRGFQRFFLIQVNPRKERLRTSAVNAH
jgi:hypothetical protein